MVPVGALLPCTCAPQVSQALRSPGSSCSVAPVRPGAVRPCRTSRRCCRRRSPTFPGWAGPRGPHARLARGRGGFQLSGAGVGDEVLGSGASSL